MESLKVTYLLNRITEIDVVIQGLVLGFRLYLPTFLYGSCLVIQGLVLGFRLYLLIFCMVHAYPTADTCW